MNYIFIVTNYGTWLNRTILPNPESHLNIDRYCTQEDILILQYAF